MKRKDAGVGKDSAPPIVVIDVSERYVTVAKPQGMLTESSEWSVPGCLETVRAMTGGEEIVVFGLEPEVSGVVLLARDKVAGDQLAGGAVVKATFFGLVSGETPPEFKCETMLEATPEGRFVEAATGGTIAKARFKTVGSARGFSAVEAVTATGGSGRLRALLGLSGWPLLGDSLYGGPLNVAGRMVSKVMLHCWRLTVTAGKGVEPITSVVQPPDDFLLLAENLFDGDPFSH